MSIRFRLAGLLSLLAATALSMAAPAQAQRRGPTDQWVKLGEQTVGFQAERDVIQVGREEGRFRAMKLIIRRNDVFLMDLRVTFRSGETQDLAVRQPIRAGGETGTLQLEASRRGDNGRIVERVDLVYKSRPGFGGQAVAELWGLRAIEGGPGYAGGPGGPGGYGGPPANRIYGGQVPKGWVLFGSQTVGFQAERDVIRLGRDAGRFKQIALRVLRNDIYLREIVINYARGDSDRLPINAEISANGVTQPIDIKDGRINDIQLVYQSRPGFRGQAVVEVYGEYTDNWIGDRANRGGGPVPVPGGPGPRGGPAEWVLLGAQSADMLQADSDVYHVGRRLGAFRQIKIRAVGHAVDIHGLRVTYANGESEELNYRASIRGGSESPPIDLRGRERFVEQIEMRYQSKLNFKGPATVELYGLH